MLSINGVKIVERNVLYIMAAKSEISKDEHWTIKVKFIEGTYVNIGKFNTKEEARAAIDEINN